MGIINFNTFKKREWNNNYCFIKGNNEILLDLADITLQEQLKTILWFLLPRHV